MYIKVAFDLNLVPALVRWISSYSALFFLSMWPFDYSLFIILLGMKECQGPALWVYNNAVFSDPDFEAIIKLSGATKSKQTEKIGGFGLGFNAVYNLTDVPSFVSRNFVVIFDPHTTHLGETSIRVMDGEIPQR